MARIMFADLSSLRFASDATLAALWGGGLLLLAGLSIWAESRRTRRKSIDAVGWVPWAKVFYACMLVGLTLLVLAIRGWLAPE